MVRAMQLGAAEPRSPSRDTAFALRACGFRLATHMNAQSLHVAVTNSLALAVIESSHVPLLLLDDALVIVSASSSFCRDFGLLPSAVNGCTITSLGDGEWAMPQLSALLNATASGLAEIEAYEIDLKRAGTGDRRLILSAHKLEYGEDTAVRLLLSVEDVTEARTAAKAQDELLREKAILLQELQHRVANSLQIVASVLMQSARRVQSDEARVHLTDAHSRVMSIAALQQQLTVSRLGDVELRPYLAALCQSIGASMIHDKGKITLDVTTDDSETTADISVSLGLIITELVINALKHAFPGRSRAGAIHVSYRSDGEAWALVVTDDGVGMPPAAEGPPSTGLGTSIVSALARQLGATVSIADAAPGTTVTIARA